MTSAEAAEQGVCEKCGGGVHIDEEGLVACDGCGVSTIFCTCEGARPTAFAPPRDPTGG